MDPSNPNNNKASRVYDLVRDVFTTLEPTNSINSVANPNHPVYNPFGTLDDYFHTPVDNAFAGSAYNPFDAIGGQFHPPVGNAVHNPVNEAANPTPNDSAQAGACTNPTKKCCHCRNQTTNPKVCNECCAKMVAKRKAWISEGICSRCGKNPARQDADGKKGKRCEECLEKQRTAKAEARERMNAAKALMQLSRG